MGGGGKEVVTLQMLPRIISCNSANSNTKLQGRGPTILVIKLWMSIAFYNLPVLTAFPYEL